MALAFKKKVGQIVSFVATAMPEFEKIHLVHFRVLKAAPLLESCVANHALWPVN